MHEVAILAATLEHLIHDEAQDRLNMAYAVHAASVDARLAANEVEAIVDTYMVIFLMGKRVGNLTTTEIRRDEVAILELYPAWPQSKKFTRDMQRSVTVAAGTSPDFSNGLLSFNATLQVVEEIGDKYGSWQDHECRDLKAALLKLEDPGTGRVPLKNFYSGVNGGQWQFTESVAYLQDLGALDATDPERKSVLIPNYIYAPSNCLISSSIYSLCCQNECDVLLGHLERDIAEPDATPARIIDLVRHLPSATEKAPREISAELRGLLDEVASQHHGRVPLHGRLFAQWMHHVYPRECPYPHAVGTTNHKNVFQWADENGIEALSASKQEIEHYTSNATIANTEGAGTPAKARALMWTAEEELVVSTTRPPMRGGIWAFFGRWAGPAVALASVCVTLWRSLGATGPRGNGKLTLPTARKAHYC